MDKSALLELIAKLEKAEAGSRELDACIAEMLSPSDDPAYDAMLYGDYPPRYTTSIDAALTLVPERTQLALNRTGFEDQADTCRAEVDWSNSTWADTLPLALCIAALKARAP